MMHNESAIGMLGFLSFGAPGLLGWIALAGIPLAIHLLHRQRHRVMDWAAMRWLLAAMKKNQRWIQVEQWLLLLLRTAIIALVILAMMKPALEQAQGLFAVLGPSTHHILVLDNSMSMKFGAGNLSRWERAKEMASSILDDARQGDFASALVMGSQVTTLVGEASPYLVSVAEEIDNLRPTDGQARIDAILSPLSSILNASPASRRHVYIITDLQRATWLGESDPSEPSRLKQELIKLADRANFTLLDVSGPESPNQAVTSVRLSDPVALLGRPVAVQATVTNYSKASLSAMPVELWVDGEVESATAVELDAGASADVAFAPVLRDLGDRSVEVRIKGDGLAADNSRWLVPRVRESIPVLVIDGEPSGEPFHSETDYLRVALAPSGERGIDFLDVTVKLESELVELNLDQWDLVLLANVGQLTETESKILSDFVSRGGGLGITLGTRTNTAEYNRVLFAEGKGLLPGRLAERKESLPPEGSGFRFDPLDYAHPLVADFRDNEQAGLLTCRTFQYWKLELPESTQAQVPLAYDSKDPALVISPWGTGQVAVLTTSADLDWNAWAISPSYVPVMQKLAQILVTGRIRRDEILVGDAIQVFPPSDAPDVEAMVLAPRTMSATPESSRPPIETMIRLDAERQPAVLEYDATDTAGIYRWQLGPPANERWLFPVNPRPAESDLTKVTEDELRGALAGWDFRLLDRWQEDEPVASLGSGGNGSISRGILYAVLALVLLEPWLAYRFSHHR